MILGCDPHRLLVSIALEGRAIIVVAVGKGLLGAGRSEAHVSMHENHLPVACHMEQAGRCRIVDMGNMRGLASERYLCAVGSVSL